MYYYKYNDDYFLSYHNYDELNQVSESEISGYTDIIYYLNRLNPHKAKRSFVICEPYQMKLEEESTEFFRTHSVSSDIPRWLADKIVRREVVSLNTLYPEWLKPAKTKNLKRWRVNIVGLGDVGGILITGLRLLGHESVESIGIYDRDSNKVGRWENEANQVYEAFSDAHWPKVRGVSKDELFDCDMFVFCVSVGVPPLEEKTTDVRMAQFEGNSTIIGEYAKIAGDRGFEGIFAVVSDPVDPLCKAAFLASEAKLLPEQIKGYGLGVMNARASYFASKNPETSDYLKNGRAYGPHGEGLIIANSIENYDEELSEYLTKTTKGANLEVRALGFKPYIAPALSSGAMSIIATIKGEWHYSSSFIGGVYMGCKNRLQPYGVEIENMDLPEKLFDKINATYKMLETII